MNPQEQPRFLRNIATPPPKFVGEIAPVKQPTTNEHLQQLSKTLDQLADQVATLEQRLEIVLRQADEPPPEAPAPVESSSPLNESLGRINTRLEGTIHWLNKIMERITL